MDDIRKILAVSRSTRQCVRVVQHGASLARKYSAELCVLSVIHDPFNLAGWNLSIPSLEDEHRRIREEVRGELGKTVATEKTRGLTIKEFVREGKPLDEILRVVRDEKIDLMLLLAHDESRLEHLLFGRTNEELVRRMPCSIFLLKSEPYPDAP